MKKHQTTGIWILLLILLVVVFASTIIFREQSTIIKDLNQTEFSKLINQGQITTVKIQGADILATGKKGALYKTVMPPVQYAANKLSETMETNGVQVTYLPAEDSGKWFNLLTSLFIPLGLLVLVILVIRSAQSGGSQAMSFGKSRARMMPENKVKTTFQDVAGVDECKQELEEIVDFLKNPERYQKLGARIPKGVLLVGAPGTGKTLLAKAVAGEAGVAFFSISGSDFVEMFVGVGASRVRDLFEQAKKHSPCIIFMDEIDAVGRQRGAGMGGGHDEREQTLNQLLVEMDGFDSTTGIILLAATNRPDILDKALLRPGRFDRQVVLDSPDIKGRFEILKVHSKNKPIAKDVDLKRLAKSTSGFTGADLENLINEGAILAARQDAEEVSMENLEQSIDKVIAGPEKRSRLISEKEKENTAYHEVGHTLIQIMVPSLTRFRKVSIIPRGMALGITWGMPDEDNHAPRRTELLGEISKLLGGRIAEQLIFGDYTTGASNDIERATNLARRFVTVYGMSEKLGPVKLGNQNDHVFMGRDFGTERNYGEEVATLIDSEIKAIIDQQYELAHKILTDNRDMMEAITKVLLEEETIDDKRVYGLMDEVLIQRGEEPRYLKNQKLSEPLSDDDIFATKSETSNTEVITDESSEPVPVES